jgi:hypothetical protein
MHIRVNTQNSFIHIVLTLKFLQLASLFHFRREPGLAEFKVAQESIVVGGTNGKDDLRPAQRGNGINGRHPVGHIGARQARRNVKGEAVKFRHNVAEHSQHGHASVLELGGAVAFKGLGVNVGRQVERVKETSGGLMWKFVLWLGQLKDTTRSTMRYRDHIGI